jgi:hypothetical protein
VFGDHPGPVWHNDLMLGMLNDLTAKDLDHAPFCALIKGV